MPGYDWQHADQVIDSFDQDALGLERVAETLTALVRNQTEPLVISLNSPWGTGKTTFLKMWQHHLINEKKCSCIYFNAWENDYVEDPLIAFIGEMDELVAQFKKKRRGVKILTGKLGEVKKYTKLLGKAAVPIIFKMITRGAVSDELLKDFNISVDDLGQLTETMVEEAINRHKTKKEEHQKLKELIGEFATQVSRQSKDFPLVILVDELDRCRPDFALTFLERIKHFLEVPNIVFVLAMDREALEAAVECRYGAINRRSAEEGKEKSGSHFSKGYLDRFFHLSLSLPPADPVRYAESIFARFNITNITSRWSIIMSPLEGYTCNDILKFSFAVMSRNLELSLREQNRVISYTVLMMNSVPTGINEKNKKIDPQAPFAYMLLRFFLTFLGVANPEAYSCLRANKTYNWGSIVPTTNNGSYHISFVEMLAKECLKALRDRMSMDNQQLLSELSKLRARPIGRGPDSTPIVYRILFKVALLNDEQSLNDIFNHIEFIGSLMPDQGAPSE